MELQESKEPLESQVWLAKWEYQVWQDPVEHLDLLVLEEQTVLLELMENQEKSENQALLD